MGRGGGRCMALGCKAGFWTHVHDHEVYLQQQARETAEGSAVSLVGPNIAPCNHSMEVWGSGLTLSSNR